MATVGEVNQFSTILRDTVVWLVREEGRDLSTRQLGILLICHLDYGPLQMRDLADRMDVGRPAIIRCVDRLGSLELMSRTVDPLDRWSQLVGRTPSGTDNLAVLQGLIAASDCVVGQTSTRCFPPEIG